MGSEEDGERMSELGHRAMEITERPNIFGITVLAGKQERVWGSNNV
jgi:hypothetical protein